jgi:hypothetical protein
MRWKIGLTLVLFTLLLAPPAAAKGPFARIFITGGNLAQPIVVQDDHLALAFLSLSMLENMQDGGTTQRPADAQTNSYLLERQWMEDDQYQTFDRVSYFPSFSGGPGYIHILETLIGTANYDGLWFHTTLAGETALKEVLAGETVTCPVTASEARPEITGSDQPLIGSGSIWLTSPDGLTAPPDAETTPASSDVPNAHGTLFVGPDIPSGFVLGATWLQGDANSYFLTQDWSAPHPQGHWVDGLLANKTLPAVNGYARYTWDGYFPNPGCYMLYVYADNTSAQVFVEVKAG